MNWLSFRSSPGCPALSFLLARPAGHFEGHCQLLVGQDRVGCSHLPQQGGATGSVH